MPLSVVPNETECFASDKLLNCVLQLETFGGISIFEGPRTSFGRHCAIHKLGQSTMRRLSSRLPYRIVRDAFVVRQSARDVAGDEVREVQGSMRITYVTIIPSSD